MENYRIYFDEIERNDIVVILRRYNDIIIDNIDDTSVGITIQKDDDGVLYRNVMEEIDRNIFSIRTESGI